MHFYFRNRVPAVNKVGSHSGSERECGKPPVLMLVPNEERVVLDFACILLQDVHERAAMKKIFVTVSGGCAYVMHDTVPSGFEVEIIDFDNIEAGDAFPSSEARNYCAKNGLHEAPRALRT